MKLIIITTPQWVEGESETITRLFRAGLELLHLRKPNASVKELEGLLAQIPANYLGNIVTHQHFELATVWQLKGIHLNGRNPQPPAGYVGHISCSCHSLHEVVARKKTCQYLFLSPIYDSISKEGYGSAYTKGELQRACDMGIIDNCVMALGGICLDNLKEVKKVGFGGAVVLGDVWRHQGDKLIRHFLKLKCTANQ